MVEIITFNTAAIQRHHCNCLPSRLKVVIKAEMLVVLWDLFITLFSGMYDLSLLRLFVSKGWRLSLLLAGKRSTEHSSA